MLVGYILLSTGGWKDGGFNESCNESGAKDEDKCSFFSNRKN